jgi:hypothetical protein
MSAMEGPDLSRWSTAVLERPAVLGSRLRCNGCGADISDGADRFHRCPPRYTGRTVLVPPRNEVVGLITSEPNECGRVRVDWVEARRQSWGFYTLADLTAVA